MSRTVIAMSDKYKMEELFDRFLSILPADRIQIISTQRRRVVMKDGKEFTFMYVPQNFQEYIFCGMFIDTLYVDEGIIKNEPAFAELKMRTYEMHGTIRIISEMYDIDARMILN